MNTRRQFSILRLFGSLCIAIVLLTGVQATNVAAQVTPDPCVTPTVTVETTATWTPEVTATWTEEATATWTPEPTATWTPEPTSTWTPEPTATWTQEPPAFNGDSLAFSQIDPCLTPTVTPTVDHCNITPTTEPTATWTPEPTATDPVPGFVDDHTLAFSQEDSCVDPTVTPELELPNTGSTGASNDAQAILILCSIVAGALLFSAGIVSSRKNRPQS